ncbi:MAG: BREX-1 system adenine-specific DNA-methyltransferase PglX [Eubacterium sp.]|nr:BREX-1 system adenine-specific DNA-methyltransferase PglX [Eubacterium sp.]
MDKTAIKNFSIWARNKLIADITYKAGLLGITGEGIKEALPQSTRDAEFYDIGTKEPYAIHGEEMKQRKELVNVIRKKETQLEYKDAYRNVIEEVAYTWFNRLISIRFMEVNDYMPAHIRVLSSESGTKLEPDLVTTPFDTEIEFTQQETEYIMQMKNDNQVDALFRFLFIKQCNALNAYLPKLFEKTSDYTELLLNVSVTDQDGIVYHLTHDIKEDDFNISKIGEDGKPTGQVEIIGWMYQYYNTEPKDEAFALLKKNVKITKERIPAATQLFTPDWIVRYMVENSVGRLWLEGHENEELKKGWNYYLDEAEQEADVEEQLKAIREEYKNIKPEEIKVIDPCMGSGHILVYAFDILMQIYESCGYSQRDAAKSIVENNIYGLDIDDRAFQLAYFAIMMKARSYNRRFLTLGIEPNLCAIQESNGIQYDKDLGDFLLCEEHRETLQYLLHTFVDAKEYGSILNVEKRDYDGFLKAWEQTAGQTAENVIMLLWYSECNQIVPILAKQAKILAQKYDVAVTNPPYMGISNADNSLSQFAKNNYSVEKLDLSTMFMKKCRDLSKKSGYIAMINIPVWMFLGSYEVMRKDLLCNITVTSLLHLGRGVFGSDFGTVAFVFNNVYYENYRGQYRRLFLKQGAVDSAETKERWYLEGLNRFNVSQDRFLNITGVPFAYWVSDKFIECFNNSKLSDIADARLGMATANNELFLKLWYEVDYRKIGFNIDSREKAIESRKKWFPYNKGGDFRKWYGNLSYVVNWENDGKDIRNFRDEKTGRIRSHNYNLDFIFRKGITWTFISSSKFSARLFPTGVLCDAVGCGLYCNDEYRYYIEALLSSCVTEYVLNVLNPSISYQPGNIGSIPLIVNNEKKEQINKLSKECMELCKEDWDSFEESFDFKRHPLINGYRTIEDSFAEWDRISRARFEKLKANEEELNRIFIDLYGLSEELRPVVENVSVRKADILREIKSLISYFVGCLFGRYSLVKEGLVFAGGEWNENLYGKFNSISNNVISITDEEYFEEDIVNLLCEWLKIVYDSEMLEENLLFIAKTLGNKGKTAKEVIRNYFLNDFFKEQCNTYSVTGSGKRPIYWLFDSGKQNGFKALIYMHRYNADTIGNLRVDYLHRMERIYESEINRMQDTIDNSSNAREVTAASKRKEKLQKQLKECQEYDEKIGHLALSRIEIDLDDGVKVNYEKVQTARDGKKYQVLAKI